MGKGLRLLNRAVAAGFLALAVPGAAARADDGQLLNDLKSDDAQTWRRAESDLLREWSKSGSPAMDLLLDRGRKALEAGDTATAIGHLTALIDHAPDFAEAYDLRATAYFQAELFGPAVADLARALQLNPNQFAALAGLGTIFLAMDRPAEALKAYRAALAIHPHLDGVEEAVKRLEAQGAGRTL